MPSTLPRPATARELAAVGAAGEAQLVRHPLGGVAVDEVGVAPFSLRLPQPGQERVVRHVVQAVPADVRDRHALGQAGHPAGRGGRARRSPRTPPASKGIWNPTQMPSSQAPRSSAARRAASISPRTASRGGAKAPTPGSRRQRAAAISAGSAVIRGAARGVLQGPHQVAEVAHPGLDDDRLGGVGTAPIESAPLVLGTSAAPGRTAHRLAQRHRHRLEGGLGGVVAVAGRQQVEMEGEPAAVRHRLEEVGHQGEREVPRSPRPGRSREVRS